MKNATLHFAAIPPEKLGAKIRKSIYGALLIALAVFLRWKGLVPEMVSTVLVGVGAFLFAGDIVRAMLPLAKDLIDFVAWAIKKLKAAFKNGN